MIQGGAEVKSSTRTHLTPSEKSNNNPLQKIIEFTYLHILQLQVVGSHYLFGILLHRRLPLKYKTWVLAW